MRFGEYFAQLRREHQQSLRSFCREHGFDPGNLSKVERGRLQPPRPDRLAVYATALGLDEQSDEWRELFDLAAAERGDIPPELLSDEEVLAKLPVLFRSLRGEAVDEEQLEKLVELIRNA